MREDISHTLPLKRDARKEGAGYGMQQTLRDAFTLFNAKNRDTKIGYTRFTPLRPKIIRKVSTTFFSESCLCLLTQCENEAAGTQQNHFPKQPWPKLEGVGRIYTSSPPSLSKGWRSVPQTRLSPRSLSTLQRHRHNTSKPLCPTLVRQPSRQMDAMAPSNTGRQNRSRASNQRGNGGGTACCDAGKLWETSTSHHIHQTSICGTVATPPVPLPQRKSETKQGHACHGFCGKRIISVPGWNQVSAFQQTTNNSASCDSVLSLQTNWTAHPQCNELHYQRHNSWPHEFTQRTLDFLHDTV